jgi:adsorption protein B
MWMLEVGAIDTIWQVRNEILLFAMAGLMLGGLDDLMIDLIWITRLRMGARPSGPQPMREAQATPLEQIAIFVPAWQEEAVIGDMLRHALTHWGPAGYCIFVGCYANDLPTIRAVIRVRDLRVRLIVGSMTGPTTKAACLNTLYKAMDRIERMTGRSFKAIVLHDAEDLVHPDELQVVRSRIGNVGLIQLPVLPLCTAGSPWISGHYQDEFAQAHGRDMIVREALGAAIPSAGVGCTINREALRKIAHGRSQHPFCEDSLTEDYELGLRLGEAGYKTIFVRALASNGQGLVATRAHFPDTLDAAVRQKARWTLGIALAGWDRLGWHHRLIENWMRLRDRRALWAALLILSSYAALILTAAIALLAPSLVPIIPWAGMAKATAGLLIWRLMVRGYCVHLHFGWRIAALSIPRSLISNIISVMAARRAVHLYLKMQQTGQVAWDKTAHRSPLAP